jgi:hypothetical protein
MSRDIALRRAGYAAYTMLASSLTSVGNQRMMA